MIIKNILINLLLLPLIGSITIFFIDSKKKTLLKQTALGFSCIIFIYSLLLWILFNNATGNFQFVSELFWIPYLNINLVLGIDGISLFFLLLTTMLIPLCLLASWDSIKIKLKEYLLCFLILEFFLIGAFISLNILFFYIFFESVLIPMYLMIGIWGSRERKIKAAYYLFLYTLLCSSPMLLSTLYLYHKTGTTDYETILSITLSDTEQRFLWLAFFLSFSSKIPMIPFHLWLPEAHVEAPTAGSVILAGVLLKLGTYGFLRYSFAFFPQACFYFAPVVHALAVMGVVYASLTAIRQTDFKRTIAYTSIAHMNLVVIGLFSFSHIGLEGAILQSVSHGFVASALFLIIGILYDRYHTRIIKYYGGLAHTMPLYVFAFLFFTMANIGLPGTGSFIGEFLILAGIFKVNTTIAFLGATGMVIGACYSLWLFNRISYGNLKTQYCKKFVDLNLREFITLCPLVLGTLVMGIQPNVFLNPIHMSVAKLVELMYF